MRRLLPERDKESNFCESCRKISWWVDNKKKTPGGLQAMQHPKPVDHDIVHNASRLGLERSFIRVRHRQLAK